MGCSTIKSLFIKQVYTNPVSDSPDDGVVDYGSVEGPSRVVKNRNLLFHPDDLRMGAYVTRMT